MLIDTILGNLASIMPVIKTLDGVLTVIRRLQQWGHLIEFDEQLNLSVVAAALASYQRRWGLPETGKADEETSRLMARRYCGCPDFVIESARGLPRWAGNSITFSSTVQLRQADLQAQRDTILQEVFAHIASKCGMTISLTQGHANIMQRGASSRTDRQLDGAGGTLAYAYLPSIDLATSRSLDQVIDLDERWSRKMFWLVVAHETGHNLGLSHNEGREIALMDPHLNIDIDGYQAWDIDQLVQRHGLPTVSPQPSPSPVPTIPTGSPLINVTVEFGGRKWTAKGQGVEVPA